jgi:energy-coupling factor transporter ATP-binding protein EcfA2
MPDDANDPVHKTPASAGEERALKSFGYQYDMLATYVYRSLVEGTLRHVWIGDPEAGKVDDGVIWTGSEIRGMQAKFSSAPGYLTFLNLCKVKDGRSLVGDLYDGYVALQSKFKGRPVFVYLTTSLQASHSDTVPGTTMDFKTFIAEAWTELATDGEEKYPDAFRKLLEATGNPKDMRAFLGALRFDFGAQPDNRDDMASKTRAHDVSSLAAFLFGLRTKPESGPADFSTTTLLSRVGWLQRAFPANLHVFPLDPEEYEPLTEAIAALETLIDQHEQRYVALLGPPGSGKSTLIQDLSEKLPDRVVRYFAFVRDSESVRPRGEALNFLHDIVSQLRESGLPYGDSLLSDDPVVLREALRTQLQAAANDFADTGKRTFIIVDGLDHVSRDPSIHESLLRELPSPPLLGRGIIIIIASQTRDGLNANVTEAIRKSTVDLANYRLSASQVRALSERILGSESVRYADEVFDRSQGHPLGVSIVLNALRDVAVDQIQSRLKALPLFGDDINAYYRGISSDLLTGAHLFDLLSTIVRLRRPIELDWLHKTWTPEVAVRFTGHFYYLFRRSGSMWSFFHDSFRQYLASATLEQYDPDCFAGSEARLQARVADRCAGSAESSIYVWEELFHRARAGEADRVLEIATLGTFRSQFLNFRTPSAILADIGVAAEVAAEEQDGVALWRTTLAAAEISQRIDVAPVGETAISLLKLGDVSKALLYSSVLEASPLPDLGERLALAKNFLEMGRRQDALMLFDSVDPVRLVRGNGFFLSDFDELRAWIRLAIPLRGQEFVQRTYERISAAVTPPEADDRTEPKFGLHRQLILGAIDAGDTEFPLFLIYGNDHVTWDDIDSVLHVHWLDETAKREFASRVAKVAAELPNVSTERLRIAYALVRSGYESEAVGLFSALQRIEPRVRAEAVDEDYNAERAFAFMELFSGHEPAVVIDVPPTQDRNDGWLDSTCRRIAQDVARLEYLSVSGAGMALSEFKVIVEDITSRLNRPSMMPVHDTYFYTLERMRSGILASVIEVAGALGESYTAYLIHIWFERGLISSWSASARRRVLKRLNIAGVGASQLIPLADAVDATAEASDVSSISGDIADAFDLRIVLKDKSTARVLLEKRLTRSLGLGYRKDYQLSAFVEPLAAATSEDLEYGLRAIRRLAGAGAALSDIVEGRAPMHFLIELVDLLGAVDIRYATSLMGELAERRSVWWLTGIYSILLAGVKAGELTFGFATRFFCEVLLPIEDGIPDDFLRDYIALLGGSDLAFFTEVAIARIKTYAMTSKRRGWLLEFESAAKRAGHDVSELLTAYIDELGRHPRDDSPESEAIPMSLSMADLLDRPHSHALVEAIRTATGATPRQVRSLAEEHPKSAELLIELAKKAAGIGANALANEIDAMAEAALPSYASWIRAYDGGLRLKLWEERVARGVEGAREAAFLDYASTLRESVSPVLLVEALRGLERISGTKWDARAVWQECENYLTALLADVDFVDVDLAPSDLSAPDWLISQHIESRAILVQEGVYRFLCMTAIDGESAVVEWLSQAIARPDVRAAAINALISAGTRDALQRLNSAREDLSKIIQEPESGADLEAALEAFAKLGVDPPTIVQRVVPPIYQFASPGASFAARELGPASEATLLNVSRIAGVDESAVVRRALSLAQQSRGRYQDLPRDLSQQTESFITLRRALSTIVAELAVSVEIRNALLTACRFFDPDLLRVVAEPRPAFLPLPSEGIEDSTTDLNLHATSFISIAGNLRSSGIYILAEWSMGRGAPYGERLITRNFALCDLADKSAGIIERVFDRRLGDGRRASESRRSLFHKNEAIALPHIRTAPWLGVHHGLLKMLDWVFDARSLRYFAADGEERARLTWWCDGQLGVNTRDSDDRSALGWLILGSPEAIDDIGGIVGRLEARSNLSILGGGREVVGTANAAIA